MERDTDMPLGEALIQALTSLRDRLAATGGDIDAAFPLTKPEPKKCGLTNDALRTVGGLYEAAKSDPIPTGDGIDERCVLTDEEIGSVVQAVDMDANERPMIGCGLQMSLLQASHQMRRYRAVANAQRERDRVRVTHEMIRRRLSLVERDFQAQAANLAYGLMRDIGVVVEDSK